MTMRDLHEELAANYSAHSSFRFERAPWQLDPSLLAEFCVAYDALQSFGHALSTSQLEVAREECLGKLSVIFGTLAPQAGDREEELFVAELHAECRRLLAEEIDHHAQRPVRGHIDQAAQGFRDQAMLLLSKRHYFSLLPESGVRDILDTCAADIAVLRERARQGRVKRDDLSVNSGDTVRRVMRILNREFAALGVLAAVSAYSGRRMTVTGLALELSVPQASWWRNAFQGMERAPQTLYAHLDESIDYPKAILYLSSVTASNGPTSCYEHAYERMKLNPLQSLVGRVVGNVGNGESALGKYYEKRYHQSMSSSSFRAHFMRLPASIRFNSHLGWDVQPDSSLEKSLLACEKTMTGPAGTFIVFDGARLLHRGGMVQQGERLALQIIFSDDTMTTRVIRKIKRILS